MSRRPDEEARMRRVEALLADAPAAAWRPETPPPLDLGRALAARPAGGAAPRASGRPAASRERRASPWLRRPAFVAVAAVLVLVIGVAAGLALAPGGEAPRTASIPAMRIALRPFPDPAKPGSGATVRMPVRAGGVARLAAHGLAPSGRHSFYEVWLMTDDTKLVSLGTFHAGPDGRIDVRFPVGVDPRDYRYVDISREPDDGNPGHSADSVLRSRALT